MNRNFKVLVAGRDKQELNALERILSEKTDYSINLSLASNGHFDPLHEIHPLPDLLILCLSDAWKEELQELSERSSSNRPPVIVIANADDETQAMRQAMRAGARDLFTRPVNTDQIVDAINHVSQEKFTQGSSNGPVLTAVVNAKGGSGATLLAAYLAHVLAKEGQQ